MAMLALGLAGAAVGGAVGGTVLGMTAASVGYAVGSFVGGVIDRDLFGGREGAGRVGDLEIQVSTYGKTLPIVHAGRIAGNLIWAAPVREVEEEVEGGKGGGGGASGVRYAYYASFAVSLCEGPVAAVRKVWADGALVWDAFAQGEEAAVMTTYLGTPDQDPDALIEASQGAGQTPAYRGQAYVVFTDLQLNDYGVRIPNLSFEVVGSLAAGWGEDLAQGMAQGLDGDVWLASGLRRTVTRFDLAALRRKAVIGRDAANAADYLGRLRAQPWRIACDPVSGHLFVTTLCDATVQRIDPATNTVIADIAVAAYPHEIVADAAGGLWVSHPWSDALSRIDAATNTVTTAALAGQPYGLCRDGGGRLWIACTQEIVHFDPVTASELGRVDLRPAGKWLPGGLAYNPADGKIWFACAGNDVVGVLDPASYALSWRNSGTWPLDAACHPGDERATVYVSLLYGNRVKLLRRGADDGLEEFHQYKTEVWPGPLLALADGRCLVANLNRPFFQEIGGP